MSPRIPLDRNKIVDFCRRHYIRKLALFGSVLRDDFRPDSDIDVLVEFDVDHVPGFIALHGIEEELSGLLGGRKIDLVTEKSLDHRILTKVLTEQELVYAEG